MLVGHLAVAFAAKRATPRLSLGTLAFAVLLADFVAFGLMFGGLEGFRVVATEATTFNGAVAADLRYSHSLAIDAVLALGAAAAFYRRRGDAAGSAILAAAVISHWPLDAISHRPDMPLVPGAGPYAGLNLWASLPGTLVVEGLPWAAAVIAYARSTSGTSIVDRAAFSIAAAFVTLAWYGNVKGTSIPPSPRQMAVSSTIFFGAIVGWAFWMNRAWTDQAAATPRQPTPPG
jgi:hypothetical protein